MVEGAMFTLSERAYTSFHPDANQKVRAVTRNGWRVARCRAPCGPIIAGDLPGRGGPPAKPSGNRKTTENANVFHNPTTAMNSTSGGRGRRAGGKNPRGAAEARRAWRRVLHKRTKREQKGRPESGRKVGNETHENRFADMEKREESGWTVGARAPRPRGVRKWRTSKKAHVFHSPSPCTTALRELPGDKVARKRDPPGALSAGRAKG